MIQVDISLALRLILANNVTLESLLLATGALNTFRALNVMGMCG